MTDKHITIDTIDTIDTVGTPGKIKLYNPYEKNVSADSTVLTDFILDDWDCQLVEPKHPALHKRASIDPFSSNTINWTVRQDEMFDLMISRFGLGLAAPQVGSSYRMFVMRHSHLGKIGVYNPEILETQDTATLEEGCLTFPLLYMRMTRPECIKVRFTKSDGVTQVETWMDGMDARCFLHEYDHLEGTMFVDLVSDFKLRRAMQQQQKRFKELANYTNENNR
jgi:peptide deformylase